MGERDEPWNWWMEATGVPEGELPKKNYVVGFPDARASDLIPTLVTRYMDSTRGEIFIPFQENLKSSPTMSISQLLEMCSQRFVPILIDLLVNYSMKR